MRNKIKRYISQKNPQMMTGRADMNIETDISQSDIPPPLPLFLFLWSRLTMCTVCDQLLIYISINRPVFFDRRNAIGEYGEKTK